MAGHADPKYVFGYDPVDQLIGATVRSNGIAGAVLRRYAYGYDKGGNRTSEQTDLGVSTATHNDVNQLTGVSASAGPVKFAGRLSETGIVYVANSLATMGIQSTSFVAYASLSTGTREVEVKATDYSNQSATNRYQVVITNNGAAKTLSYDINGNLTNVAAGSYTNKYEWDGADRLTRISWRQAGGGWHVTDFTYDGLGRRVKITETTNNIATTNTFVWCGTELCEERNSSGATVNKRFFGQGEQISGTAYFFTRDHLGSIREMSNSGGTIQARYEYDPYGRRTKVSGSGEAAFAFTGHYYHQKSGFYLALYRAYDADTGRWLSRDPIEEEGGVNLYAYVENEPLGGIDTLGNTRVRVKLPQGYIGRIDQWTDGATGPGFQLHVFDRRGKEVAVVRSTEVFQERHKGQVLKRPSELPKELTKAIRKEIRTRNRSVAGAARRSTISGGGLTRMLFPFGVGLSLLSMEASAAEMVETLETIATDCSIGNEDWAYVGMLTLRHQLNQQAPGSGDIALREMLKAVD